MSKRKGEMLMVTANLKQLIELELGRLPKDRHEEFINQVMERYNGSIMSLRELRMGRPRYELIRMVVDRALEGAVERSPCGKGCDECCHIQVCMSESEAAMLVEHLMRSREVSPTWARGVVSKLLGMQGMPTDPSEWHRYSKDERACPFLDRGRRLCTVYGIRPLACRSYLVHESHDPKKCELTEETVRIPVIGSMHIEILYSALEKLEQVGSMSWMMTLALNRERGREGVC